MNSSLQIIPVNNESIAFADEVKEAIHLIVSQENFTIYTSGSTGKPKAITHNTDAAFASAKATIDFLKIKEKSTAFLALPIDKIGGKMVLYRALLLQQKIIVAKPALNPLKNLVLTEKIVFASFTPLQLYHILADKHTAALLSFFEVILIGGARVSNDLIQQLKTITTTRFYETFGMTETISHIALKNLSKGEEKFQLLPNISIETDSLQRLIIQAPDIASSPIYTNDIVQITEKDKFDFIGRNDNVINSGGLKYFPEQIEAKLSKKIIFPFYITSKNDAALGEKIVIVLNDNLNIDKYELHKIFEQLLTKHEIPKEIIYQPFSYTENGKILRRKF